MTNKEWLDYLANNAPDELAAWFDAEHVETEERALDGDTEPENGDSREQLEAEIESYSAFDMMDTITLDMVIGWLDRQAAITERECCKYIDGAGCDGPEVVHGLNGRIAELQAKITKLTAEREHYREKFGKCLDYADAIHALMDEGMA